MNTRTKFWPLVAGTLTSALLMSGYAVAAPIKCDDAYNYMQMDDSQATACLASGKNNPSFTGNPVNDIFLNNAAGTGYQFVEKSENAGNPTALYNLEYGQTDSTGTWEFDSSLWDSYSTIAIGFKFGGGNKADNWFVYELNSLVSSGDWAYFGKGNGLSHVSLYGKGSVTVPEPGSLALLGVGIIGLTLVGRKRRAN